MVDNSQAKQGRIKMILILGGNSYLGRMIIEKLQWILRKDQFAISVRNLAKAQDLIHSKLEVRHADFDDKTTLKKAFSGITKLFFISGTAPVTERIQQHKNVIEAAQEIGVQHVFYTSFIDVSLQSPFAFSTIHEQTESFIKRSGLIYTILRNNLYADFLARLAQNAADTIRVPAGLGKVAFIAREDIADFAINVLTQSKMHHNTCHHLTGARAYSFSEIAKLMTSINKKTVLYKPNTPEHFSKKLMESGTPEWMSHAITSMYVAVSHHTLGYGSVSRDFENIVGRPAQEITKFITI